MIAISTTLAFTPWAVFGLVEGSHFAGPRRPVPTAKGPLMIRIPIPSSRTICTARVKCCRAGACRKASGLVLIRRQPTWKANPSLTGSGVC